MKTLFRNARVITFDDAIGDLPRGDVLVSETTVEAVGVDLEAADAQVVDADGMLLMPGMVDSHTHLWEALFRGRVSEAWGSEYFGDLPQLGSFMTPEAVYGATYAGAVELLDAGVTTVFDYCHCILSPEHADAALDALRAAGIRAVFGYDLAGRDPAGHGSLGPSQERFPDVERVAWALAEEPLLTLAVCLSGVGPDDMERTGIELAFARGLGCLTSYHNNAGGELVLLDEAGLLGPDVLPAHGNYTTDDDLERLGAVGGCLTTQTEAETYAGRRSMSMMGRGHRRGVRIALGVDVPALVNSAVMTQMRLVYFLQRYMDGMHERLEGQVPVARRPGVPTFTARDVLRFGTVNGAAAVGLGEAVGRIAPGCQADLVLLDARRYGMADGDPAAHVVLNSSLADVHTVMVAGAVRKREGRMVGVDHAELVAAREAAAERVLASAGVGEMRRTYWDWTREAARS